MVHEAGHAVGRFLVAARLGFDPNDAISHIDVYGTSVPVGRKSFDGTAELRCQATTFGPMFSRALDELIRTKLDDGSAPRDVPLTDVARILADARAAGLDVDEWFRAKALSHVLGPMAEAKLLGKPFEAVWNEYGSEDDMVALAKEGTLAGLTAEQIETAEKEIIDVAALEIARPEVWRAILTLADSLQPGRTSGRKVAAIIARALENTDQSASTSGTINP